MVAAVRVSTPQLGERTLQVRLHRSGAGTENAANPVVDPALERPVQHLGLARSELERQAHGLDDPGVGHLAIICNQPPPPALSSTC